MEVTILYFVTYIIEALIAWQFFSDFYKSKYSKLVEGIIIVCGYLLLFFCSLVDKYYINIGSFLIGNFLLVWLLYQAGIVAALIQSIVLFAAMGWSELLVGNIMSFVNSDFYATPKQFGVLAIFGVFSKFIYYVLTIIMSILFSKSKIKTKDEAKDYIGITFVVVVTGYVLYTFYSICFYSDLPRQQEYLVAIGSALLLLADIVLFWFYKYIQIKNARILNMQLELQKESDSVNYYMNLVEQNENLNILVHDMKNHFQTIQGLNERNDKIAIERYIDHLLHSSELKTCVNMCNHSLLNGILNRYYAICKKENIEFLVDIRNDSINILSDYDITALFGNLLDNALEAARLCKEGFIELNISYMDEKNISIITLINSCEEEPLNNIDGKFVSKKKDGKRHGFGLRSVKKTVNINQGDMHMHYDNAEKIFRVTIVFPSGKANVIK